jgi:hypothetical protein
LEIKYSFLENEWLIKNKNNAINKAYFLNVFIPNFITVFNKFNKFNKRIAVKFPF